MERADDRNHNHMTFPSFSGPAPEATVTGVATKWGMGGGTLSSVYGWMTSNEAVILIGLSITVLGFIINIVYQRRRDHREAEVSRQRMDFALAEERRREEKHQTEMRLLQGKALTE